MELKCQKCGLVNWTNEVQTCQRCQTPLIIESREEKLNRAEPVLKKDAGNPEPKKVPFLMHLLFLLIYLIGIAISMFGIGFSFVLTDKINIVTITILSVVISFFLPLAITHGLVESWRESIRYPHLSENQHEGPEVKLTIADLIAVFGILTGFIMGLVFAIVSVQYCREWGLPLDELLVIPALVVGIGTWWVFIRLNDRISRWLGYENEKPELPPG